MLEYCRIKKLCAVLEEIGGLICSNVYHVLINAV